MKKWAKIASAILLAASLSVTGFGAKPAEAAANKDTVQESGNNSPKNLWMASLFRSYSQQPQVRPASKLVAAKAQLAKPTVAGMTYSKTLSVKASSYGPSNINWKYGGRTYTGTKIREGVISVDPKVIPLGTKVYVTGYSTPLLPAGGFVAKAEDTGKTIKGNRIDIYMDGTKSELRQFGMQNVKIYVLK